MNTDGKEKRRNTRINFETQVIVKTANKEITAVANSKNISMKGIFIETHEKIPVGTECDIQILLSGTSSKLSLSMNGKVVRQIASGIGIAFNTIEIDSFFHLRNLIMYNSSDPDAIENELFNPQ